jgi:hypothetical protein
MSKSSTSKVSPRKSRELDPKASSVRGRKAGKHPKNAPATAIERSNQKGRKTVASAAATAQTHDTHRKMTPQVAAEKPCNSSRKSTPETIAEKPHAECRVAADQSEETHDARTPDSMRALAQRNVAQMREHYRRSKDALQGMLEVWEKSFGVAGQDAVTLNRKIMDIADRNINTGFDLAESLAGARNLVEVLELQAACWRKLFGELQSQDEEARELSRPLSQRAPLKAL